MPTQNDADADDDAAAAANTRRVEVMATFLIVDQDLRVRFPYAAPRGDGSSGNTSGLHPEIRGSNPRRSTERFMLSVLNILGPLWRLCTNSIVQVGRWCGARTPNPGLLSPILSRPAMGRWPSGKAFDCKSEDRGFDTRSALQENVVVIPTQGPRTGTYQPCAGLAQFGRAAL